MTFGSHLIIDVVTLATECRWAIIEIVFSGVHDHRWPYGDKIQDYILEEIARHKPAGIVFNFLDYKYTWGNELWGPIFIACTDLKKKTIRPCSILAMGQTAESIKSLLVEANAREILNIEIFYEKAKALEYLAKRLNDVNG